MRSKNDLENKEKVFLILILYPIRYSLFFLYTIVIIFVI